VEQRYPEAERFYLVQDNLNTHTAGALYETFPPTLARSILDRLEFHPTPKHGSWLNQAETLDQRLRARLPLPAGAGYGDLTAAGADAGGRAQRAPRHHRLAVHRP
jgi:hypothetical protein